jgi:hypothetical protein
MESLDKQKTQWKEDLYFAVKVVRQMLSKYYCDVPPTTGLVFVSAHILDFFRKLRSCSKWDQGMDINSEYETSETTQYQEAFLSNVEIKYFAKHRQMCVIEPDSFQPGNFFPSAKASGFGQLSLDPYNLSSNDDEYLTPKCMGETTPG